MHPGEDKGNSVTIILKKKKRKRKRTLSVSWVLINKI